FFNAFTFHYYLIFQPLLKIGIADGIIYPGQSDGLLDQPLSMLPVGINGLPGQVQVDQEPSVINFLVDLPQLLFPFRYRILCQPAPDLSFYLYVSAAVFDECPPFFRIMFRKVPRSAADRKSTRLNS